MPLKKCQNALSECIIILKKIIGIFLSNIFVINGKKLVKYNLPVAAAVLASIEHPALEHSVFFFHYIFVFAWQSRHSQYS